MTEPRDIEKDKAMCEAASYGAWTVDDVNGVIWSSVGKVVTQIDCNEEPDDHEFIAESRAALPYYITQYEDTQIALEIEQAKNEDLETMIDHLNGVIYKMTAAEGAAHARIAELERQLQNKGCTLCGGKGYFECKTGVVSPHIPYEEEIAKEPCDCVLEQLEMRAAYD